MLRIYYTICMRLQNDLFDFRNDFDSSEISFKYASKLKITDNIIHN